MKRDLIRLFVLCYMVLSAGCKSTNGSIVSPEVHPEVIPVNRTNVEWWMPRHDKILERIARGNVDLIFIGDSITQRWETTGQDVWEKYYTKRNAVNMGINGDRTQHVLWRLENGEIDGISPKLAILMIGTNNCNAASEQSAKTTAKQIADGIEAIVQKLKTGLPETKILILGIFPRGSTEQFKEKAAEAVKNWQWEKIDEINEILSNMSDNKMIYYLNINNEFLNEKGSLTRKIAPDLVHLSNKGYQIWAESMEPTVKKLMGEVDP